VGAVQPNHVRGLGLEVRVVGDHVDVQPVRSHTVLSPDALHSGERHIAQLGMLHRVIEVQPISKIQSTRRVWHDYYDQWSKSIYNLKLEAK
jgi:hypothetical protein